MLCIPNCFSMWSNECLTRNPRTEGKIFISFCTKIHNIMLASVPGFVPCVDTIDTRLILLSPVMIWCVAPPKHRRANIGYALQRDCNTGIIQTTSGETEARNLMINTKPVSQLQSGLRSFCLLLPLLLQRHPPSQKKYTFHTEPEEKSLFQKKKWASRWLIEGTANTWICHYS